MLLIKAIHNVLYNYYFCADDQTLEWTFWWGQPFPAARTVEPLRSWCCDRKNSCGSEFIVWKLRWRSWFEHDCGKCKWTSPCAGWVDPIVSEVCWVRDLYMYGVLIDRVHRIRAKMTDDLTPNSPGASQGNTRQYERRIYSILSEVTSCFSQAPLQMTCLEIRKH